MGNGNDRKDMDEFEKVEKLRQRADVSYEEARDALRACEGDLLDAMVYLEKMGQAKAPEQPTFSTNAEEKQSYENVPEAVVRSQDTKSDPSFGEQLGHLLKTAFQKSVDNFLVISHRGEEKFRLPILVVVLLIFVFNFAAVVALIVSLFFDVKYQFTGKDDLSKVNRMMDEAGTKATGWMAESYKHDAASERQAADRQAEKQARREEHYAEKQARREEHYAEKQARREEHYAEKQARREEHYAGKYGSSDKGMDHAKEDTPSEPLETFAKKEIDDLTKKYDDSDKNSDRNK